MDLFTRASSGSSIKGIPAELYNLTIENDKDYLRRRGQKAGDVHGAGLMKIGIVNTLGVTLEQYSVVGIGTAVLAPASTDTSFFGRLTFEAAVPNATQTFAILQEPAQPETLVTAILSGPSLVMLDVKDITHRFAAPALGVTGGLTSASKGPAKIVWKRSGVTGNSWALVVIDDSSTTFISSPPPEDELFPAYITHGALKDGYWVYTGTEQTPGAVPGTYSTLSGGRTFDKTVGPWLVELNNTKVKLPQYVWVRYKSRINGIDVFEIDRCCEEIATGPSSGVTYYYKVHSIDALLSAQFYKQHSIDAYLKKTIRRNHRISALLAKQYLIGHRLDCYLAAAPTGDVTYNASGTFTVPSTTFTVHIWGAGANGTAGTGLGGGFGGAGGGYSRKAYSGQTIGHIYDVNVDPANGGASSWFDSVTGQRATSASGGTTGSGADGDVNRAGGEDGAGSFLGGGGGGGGSPTSSADGNAGTNGGASGGAGGSGEGTGGTGGNSGAAGSAATAPGAGGGGGGLGGGNPAGGAGAAGRVYITWP